MPIQINKKIKNKKCVIGEVKTGSNTRGRRGEVSDQLRNTKRQRVLHRQQYFYQESVETKGQQTVNIRLSNKR